MSPTLNAAATRSTAATRARRTVAASLIVICGSGLASKAFVTESSASRRSKKQALRVFKRGVRAYQGGHFAEAAQLFARAFKADRRPVYLYNEARARQQAGERDTAADLYDQARKMTGAPLKLIARCNAMLAEIDQARRREAAIALQVREDERRRAQIASQAREKRAAADATRKRIGWSAVVAGGVGLGVGGWLIIGAVADQAALDTKTEQVQADGKISGFDAQSYNAELDRLDRNRVIGASALAVGAAAMGFGAWWLSTSTQTDDARLSWSVHGRRLVVTGRF